jgi:hypothetical protein
MRKWLKAANGSPNPEGQVFQLDADGWGQVLNDWNG